MSRIVAIIEARMTSSRLPGKMLLQVCGKTILELLIERVSRISQLSDIVVATTWNDTDDPIHELCRRLDIKCYRGSENDVLGRVLGAAKTFEADHIVEITGDCPLLDPGLGSACISDYFELGVDYAVVSARYFPSGTAIQIFPTSVLSEVDREYPDDPSAREHVSLPIYSQGDRYKVYRLPSEGEFNRPDLRFDLDTYNDFKFIEAVFDELYPDNPMFGLDDVLGLLERRPELKNINADVQQKQAGQ